MRKRLDFKRYLLLWFVLGAVGISLITVSLLSFLGSLSHDISVFKKVTMLLLGIFLLFLYLRELYFLLNDNNIYQEMSKEMDRKKLSIEEYRKKQLLKGPKIVVIGGGTGLSVLLAGLKKYTDNITAIVTVADDGGGSGVLREDLGMLPPGDIRSCIIALANTEPKMEKLLQYRFSEGSLKGQSFGNLLIAAMNEIYGSFEMAIKETSNVLAVTGKVLPMTIRDVVLKAELSNGRLVSGESRIPEVCLEDKASIKRISLEPEDCYPLEESLEAIEDADLIVLGPGSLYTSIIPNLLVKGMREALMKTPAKIAYISNIMTQPGETDNYGVLDHLEAVLNHSDQDLLDYIIVNNEKFPKNVLDKYYLDGSMPVYLSKKETKKIKNRKIEIITDNLVEVKKDYIRHDAERLSEILINLANKK